MLVVAVLELVLVLGLFDLMKQSDAYQFAYNRARTDPAVIAQLGDPIRDGWYLHGSINLTNDDGDANLAFPLKGPKGGADVYVVAKKTAGRWRFQQLLVVTDWGRRQIDLRDPPERAGAGPGSR